MGRKKRAGGKKRKRKCYKGDNFTAGLNIGPGGKTSALLGATTTDGKYSGGLEFKSTGDVSGYVAAGKQKLTYNKNDGFGVNITAGALNIVASQHGDTVVNATVGTGKFSLNTTRGTMSSSINSGSNGITAGENLITSLDDLMSKTDSMAEANRQRALDEARKADLDKIKNDKSDPRYNPDYATMSEEDIRKDIKTRSESGDLVSENVEGIARGESRGDGFLENTLGDMKDDLMGAIAWLQMIFSLRNAFLAIAVFFVLSLLINTFVNEKRGIETANNYKE